MKIYSLSLDSFIIEAPGQKKVFFKSNDLQINVDEGRITVYDRNDTYIFRNLNWEDVINFEDNAFGSEEEAINYLINVIHVRTIEAYNVKDLVIQRLNNGTTDNMNVNGSVTPKNFVFSSTEDIILTRLEVFMSSTGIFGVDDFADIAAGLTNGCLLTIAGVTRGLWKNNRDVALTGAIASTDFLSNQDKNLQVVTDLRGLFLPRNESIELLIQDDLSTLEFFYFTVNGYKVND